MNEGNIKDIVFEECNVEDSGIEVYSSGGFCGLGCDAPGSLCGTGCNGTSCGFLC